MRNLVKAPFYHKQTHADAPAASTAHFRITGRKSSAITVCRYARRPEWRRCSLTFTYRLMVNVGVFTAVLSSYQTDPEVRKQLISCCSWDNNNNTTENVTDR